MAQFKAYYLPKPGGAVNVINPSGYEGSDIQFFLAKLRPVYQWLCVDVDGERAWTNPEAHPDDLGEIVVPSKLTKGVPLRTNHPNRSRFARWLNGREGLSDEPLRRSAQIALSALDEIITSGDLEDDTGATVAYEALQAALAE